MSFIKGVSVSFGPTTALEKKINAMLSDKAADLLPDIGIAAKEIFEREAGKAFYDRPASRRNPQNRLRYTRGAYWKVTRRPARLVFANRARHAAIMETGSVAHSMPSTSVMPGPRGIKGLHDGVTPIDAFGSRKATKAYTQIWHPGTDGYHLMEISLQQALARSGVKGGGPVVYVRR